MATFSPLAIPCSKCFRYSTAEIRDNKDWCNTCCEKQCGPKSGSEEKTPDIALPLIKSVIPQPCLRALVVGESSILEEFAIVFKRHNIQIPLKLDPGWGRDSRLTNFTGLHLVPYSIKDKQLTRKVQAILPISCKNYMSPQGGLFGEGFEKKIVEQAQQINRKWEIPFRRLRSTIEGGNGFIFFDQVAQKPKAVIGIFSVFLTIIGLEEQGYFEEFAQVLNDLREQCPPPDDDAVRAARNQNLLEKAPAEAKDDPNNPNSIQHALAFKRSLQLCREFEKPVSQADREIYKEKAKEVVAKSLMTKQFISKEIRVPLENIAFTPNPEFHIDMVMFVNPNGHDVYVDSSVNQEFTDSLKTIGLIVHPLPGVGRDKSNRREFNFMNGTWILTRATTLFITNGVFPQFEKYRKIFDEAIKATKPGFKVDYLGEKSQEAIIEFGGGSHCLSWEIWENNK